MPFPYKCELSYNHITLRGAQFYLKHFPSPAALVAPYASKLVFTTKNYKDFNIRNFIDEAQLLASSKEHARLQILSRFYQLSTVHKDSLEIFLKTPDTELEQWYALEYDDRFVEIIAPNLPKLPQRTLQKLYEYIYDDELWEEHVPSHLITFSGCGFMYLRNIHQQKLDSQLKEVLLRDRLDEPNIIEIEGKIRTLLNNPSLHLGFCSLKKEGNLVYAHSVGRSYVVRKHVLVIDPEKYPILWKKVIVNQSPMLLNDIEHYQNIAGTAKILLEQGFQSLNYLPLIEDGELLGMAELVSPEPLALNRFTLERLSHWVDLFAVALSRSLREHENELQAIIQEKFTTIQPVVQWRFKQVAERYYQDSKSVEDPKIDKILFRNVFPLFGVSDIRGSSIYQAEISRDDLVTEIELLNDILETLPISAAEALRFRLNTKKEDIITNYTREDDFKLINLIEKEITPLVKLYEDVPITREKLQKYRSMPRSERGLIYQKTAEFDAQINELNQVLIALLLNAQRDAQAVYPHFFQYYKTDGIEHSLYIGESLVQGKPFNKSLVENLRLWQMELLSSSGISIKKILPHFPLGVAHLIFSHDFPIHIRFRQDEKRFDVDGAYNVHYEVVKKRIDKATILGTDERLCQPDTLSVIYTQSYQLESYLKYFEFLKSKGKLTGEAELLTLNDETGVSGLSALRFKINAE